MLPRYFLLLLLLLMGSLTFAQQNALSAPNPNKVNQIKQARFDLLNAIRYSQNKKIILLEKNLFDLQDSLHLTIYPIERVMTWYLTGQYQQIVSYYQTDTIDPMAVDGNRYFPASDSLAATLRDKLFWEGDDIPRKVSTRYFSLEKEDFLLLNLHFIQMDGYGMGHELRQLNARCLAFVNQYPQSPFNNYVMRKIYKNWTEKSRGFGMSFNVGSYDFMGGLGNSFDGLHILDVPIEVSLNQHDVFVRYSFGRAFVTDSVRVNSGAFSVAARPHLDWFQMGYGHHFFTNQLVELVPYTAWGLMGLDLRDNLDMEERGEGLAVITGGHTFSAGLLAEFKLYEGGGFDEVNMVFRGGLTLRARYEYSLIRFPGDNKRFNSQMHTFSIGIGIATRIFNKDRKRQIPGLYD